MNKIDDRNTVWLERHVAVMTLSIGIFLQCVLSILPPDAKKDFTSEIHYSKGTSATPSGSILIAVYILEMMGFRRNVDRVLDEESTSIETMNDTTLARMEYKEGKRRANVVNS